LEHLAGTDDPCLLDALGNDDAIKQIRDAAITFALNGASHRGVLTKTREWVRQWTPNRVSDACVAETVRKVFTEYGQKQTTGQRPAEEEKRVAEWNTLSEREKCWVVGARIAKSDAPVLDCQTMKIGAVGVIRNSMTVTIVRSASSAIVELDCASGWFGKKRSESTGLWFDEIETHGMTTGGKWKFDGAVEVVGTKSYKPANGDKRTIFNVRPPRQKMDVSKLSKIVPPQGVKLEDCWEIVK
jgi:hypothetical protein